MRYKISSTRSVNIPDKELHNLMTKLELSEKEAIETWLEDNGYEINDEQEQLDAKAKDNNANLYIMGEEALNTRATGRKIKASDEKVALFADILSVLQEKYGEKVEILIDHKKLVVKFSENQRITVDLIENRKPKA